MTDTLLVSLSGTPDGGVSPLVEIWIDQTMLVTNAPVTALEGSNQSQVFAYTGTWDHTVAHGVFIWHKNADGTRSICYNGITYDGVFYAPPAANVLSSGAVDMEVVIPALVVTVPATTISNATLASDGVTLTMAFSQAVTLAAGDVSFVVAGAARAATNTDAGTLAASHVFVLASPAHAGEVVTYSTSAAAFTAPVMAGTVSTVMATNGSTQSAGPAITGLAVAADGVTVTMTMNEALALNVPQSVPVGVDGVGYTGQTSGGASVVVNLTTTKPNDIVVVYVEASFTGGDTTVAGIADTAGLTWAMRATIADTSGNTLQEWWAKAPAVLTNDAITISFTHPTSFTAVSAFGVSGINVASPFDTNTGLPFKANSTQPTFSTTAADTFVIAGIGFGSSAAPTAGAGWTPIASGQANSYLLTEAWAYTSPQVNTAALISAGNGDEYVSIVDALVPQPAPASNFGITVAGVADAISWNAPTTPATSFTGTLSTVVDSGQAVAYSATVGFTTPALTAAASGTVTNNSTQGTVVTPPPSAASPTGFASTGPTHSFETVINCTFGTSTPGATITNRATLFTDCHAYPWYEYGPADTNPAGTGPLNGGAQEWNIYGPVGNGTDGLYGNYSGRHRHFDPGSAQDVHVLKSDRLTLHAWCGLANGNAADASNPNIVSGILRFVPNFRPGSAFEIRCKMPAGMYSWPAFWLNTGNQNDWVADSTQQTSLPHGFKPGEGLIQEWTAEVDIFDEYGFNNTPPGHYLIAGDPTPNGDAAYAPPGASAPTDLPPTFTDIPGLTTWENSGWYANSVQDLTADFHTFGLQWNTDNTLGFYLDGVLYRTRGYVWPATSAPAQLIASLQIGAWFNDLSGISPNGGVANGWDWDIQYIRAWNMT